MAERMKTALEKAMERVAQIEVSGDEIEREHRRITGKSLAARFIAERNFDLLAVLNEYSGDAAVDVRQGALETLLGNVHPPANEAVAETNKRAMEGILLLKKDRQAVQQILGEMEYLFDYYLQSLRQVQVNLREAFEKRAAEAQRKIEAQTGVRVRVNPETSPEFREEWLRTVHQIEVQYEEYLKQHKTRLAGLE